MGVILGEWEVTEFPERHPQLLSCAEVVRLCPGWQDESCGDEVDGFDELCPAHRRAEDRHYQLQAMEEEGVEPLVPYPHLTDRG